MLALMFQEGGFPNFRGEIARYVEEFLLKMKSGSARMVVGINPPEHIFVCCNCFYHSCNCHQPGIFE